MKSINQEANGKKELPDAIIAATCLINNCTLVTNNLKDFEKIIGLDFIKV
jgi:predicted nucleic acid-binding protein